MPTAKEILRRYEELKNHRGTWDAHWQEIADYGLGRRDFQATTSTPGRKRTTQIYDSTFMRAGGMLASGLHSLLSNPATRWFRLKLEDADLMEIERVALWMALTEERLYDAFNRPEAGFSMAQHEGFVDIVFFGTGGVFIEEDRRGPIFMSAPIGSMFLGENQHQRLDTYMWLRKMTARQIVMDYGRGASERADKSVDRGAYEEEYEILRAVMPREDPQVRGATGRTMPWASYTVAVEETKTIRESGFNERPFAMARWNKEAGETYGRGPGVEANIPQKVTNEQQKTVLKAAQKRTDPPLFVPSGDVVQALQTEPGGVSVIKAAYMQGQKPPVFELGGGGDIGIGIEMIEMSRADIRSAFHWELLQLIQHTPGTTPPSAEQVYRIAENQQRVISPTLGRLQSELLEAEIERVFGIEWRAGRLPPVPPELADAEIKVEYVSPAVRAQRNQDAQAVRRTMMTAAEYSQVDALAAKILKSDEAMRVIAEAEGVPVSVIRSRAEMEEILEAERKLAEEQAQQAAMMQTAEAAGRAAPALKAIQGGRA